MSKHITSRRDRQSAKYKSLHHQLRIVIDPAIPASSAVFVNDKGQIVGAIEDLDKRERKKQRSRDFMAGRD